MRLRMRVQPTQAPRWPLFLGRKTCVPTRPIFEDFTVRYAGLEEALHQHPWSWLGTAMLHVYRSCITWALNTYWILLSSP